MPKQNDTYLPHLDHNDTVIIDTDSDVTYDFIGRAPRGEVVAAGSAAAAQAAGIWYIYRVPKASPHIAEKASNQYNKVWDDRASLTTYL